MRETLLPPGQYVFKLMNSMSDRHIVQIFNADESHIIDTELAIPNYRLEPTGKSRFTFYETPAGYVKAMHAWFYPGDNFGQEFRYPKNLQVAMVQTAAVVMPQPEPPAAVVEAAPVEQPAPPETAAVVEPPAEEPAPAPVVEATPAPVQGLAPAPSCAPEDWQHVSRSLASPVTDFTRCVPDPACGEVWRNGCLKQPSQSQEAMSWNGASCSEIS